MDSDGGVHYALSGVVGEHRRRWSDASSARARRVIDALSPETPEAQLVMRNVHILKHAMVGGIGLRQLCDLAMAYRHFDGQYDPASLTGKLREAGLGKWNGLLNAFLVQVIGCEYIDKEDKVPAADLEWLVRAVLDDGNFGRRRQSGSGKPKSGALALMGSAISSGKPKSGALALMGSALSRGFIFMKYAPCEYIARIRSLVKGRMKRKIKNS